MNVILSIKPKWAELIYSGKKTIEWRKSFPKAKNIDKVLLYETAPVKAITGFFKFDKTVCIESLPYIDPLIVRMGCVPFDALKQYKGNSDCLYGWMIADVTKFEDGWSLNFVDLKRPPQSWCYVKDSACGFDKDGFFPF